MPTKGGEVEISYRAFARAMAALPLSATCADLVAVVREYQACEVALRGQLLAAVEGLPLESEWLVGLLRLCDVLKAENPRFIPVLMMEWCLEGK